MGNKIEISKEVYEALLKMDVPVTHSSTYYLHTPPTSAIQAMLDEAEEAKNKILGRYTLTETQNKLLRASNLATARSNESTPDDLDKRLSLKLGVGFHHAVNSQIGHVERVCAQFLNIDSMTLRELLQQVDEYYKAAEVVEEVMSPKCARQYVIKLFKGESVFYVN